MKRAVVLAEGKAASLENKMDEMMAALREQEKAAERDVGWVASMAGQ